MVSLTQKKDGIGQYLAGSLTNLGGSKCLN